MKSLNLNKTAKYLLACSFGPDSMSLFHLLKEEGIDFECAIVNYHLRKESDSEVESLIKYASQFNIKVHVFDVKELITKNIESRCREIRYGFFKELCDKYGFEATLVAHNQDDHIETYLLQKERQNYPIFYGINEKTMIHGVNIVRPLLDYTKQELQDICVKNNVPFSIDQSNFDTKIKRNKIRHEIVAKMSLSERRSILKEIDRENIKIRSVLDSIIHNKLCEVDYVLSLDRYTLSYALNLYVKEIDNSLFLSKNDVGQVIDIIKSSKSNGQFPVKKGLYLIKEYENYYFSNHKLEEVEFEYKVESPSKLDTPYFYLNFTSDTKNRNVSLDDYPLIIRHVHKNDFVFINGYKAEARRLLIDWKVPFRKRLIWPAIFNKNGKCIYIPRYQKAFVPDSSTNFYVK